MEFTIKDVSKHTNLATTPELKEQWLRVANSTLKTKKDQGYQDCEELACNIASEHIKQITSRKEGTQWGRVGFTGRVEVTESKTDEKTGEKTAIIKVLQGETNEGHNGISLNNTYYSKEIAEGLASIMPPGSRMFVDHVDREKVEELSITSGGSRPIGGEHGLAAVIRNAWGTDGATFAEIKILNKPSTEWVHEAMIEGAIGVSIDAWCYCEEKEVHGKEVLAIEGWDSINSVDFVGEPAAGGKFIAVGECVKEGIKILKEEPMKTNTLEESKKIITSNIEKLRNLEGINDLPGLRGLVDFLEWVMTHEDFGDNEKVGKAMDAIAGMASDFWGAHIHWPVYESKNNNGKTKTHNQQGGTNSMDNTITPELISKVSLEQLTAFNPEVITAITASITAKVKEGLSKDNEVQELTTKVNSLEAENKTISAERDELLLKVKSQEAATKTAERKTFVEGIIKDLSIPDSLVDEEMGKYLYDLDRTEEAVKGFLTSLSKSLEGKNTSTENPASKGESEDSEEGSEEKTEDAEYNRDEFVVGVKKHQS